MAPSPRLERAIPRGEPVPYRRMAAALLANWRAVEWQILLIGPVDVPEAMALQAKADWLRNEYEDLILRAREAGLPEPLPFPSDAGPEPPNVARSQAPGRG